MVLGKIYFHETNETSKNDDLVCAGFSPYDLFERSLRKFDIGLEIFLFFGV